MGEVGALGAEMIMDRRKVIFITDMRPGGNPAHPDGVRFRYFFWDAWYKKLIDRNNLARNASLAETQNLRRGDVTFADLRAGARLDSRFYFNDLWNSLAYHHGGTIWNRIHCSKSFTPLKLLPDNEPQPPPPDVRHASPDYLATIDPCVKRLDPSGLEKEADGQWTVPPAMVQQIQKKLEVSLPKDELRRRTIVIETTYEPFVMARMPPDQHQKLAVLSSCTEKEIQAAGMRCLNTFGKFTDEDFADHVHFTGAGGAKLAADLAPLVRALAADLGYTKQQQQPSEGQKK
ncbi:hypothetical protein DES53_101245 [Roseimicrobium gellanilyticum]|uniref:Uncharacterized protein n=2 Tax=Roseimicrobium gellanilyticum TaxID=748857 RepID=A0A366HVY1_9BACT|nr:hypothetical protein DES53_101245 [Roseimicrobium gellanilyticum]